MRCFLTVLFFAAVAAGTVTAQESAFPFSSDAFSSDITREDDSPANRSVKGSTESYESIPITDGQDAVQKKAMFRAEQRQLRIASRQWYGFSQSRPVVAAVPYMTNYSPLWVGRHWHPYHSWYGTIWR